MKINYSFIRGALLGALVTFGGITYFGVTTGMINILNNKNDSVISSDVEEKLQLMDSYMDQYFLYDVDQTELEEMIYLGYVAGLGDKYSTYYNKEETLELLEATSGEYSGVGAQLSQDISTGIITITQVFDGTPAQEGGLEVGDILYKVAGEEVTELELTVAVSKIKGEEGTDVELVVLRGDNWEEFTTTMTRRTIQTPTVNHEMLDNGIGYIEVTQFDTVTVEQYAEAMADLEASGMESLIIDLRYNPGGTLNSVCEMLDMMLPEGLLVYTEDKYGNRQEEMATGTDRFDKPVIVLINGYSASASEIFAGVIQDTGLGKVVGNTSYGKGVVQQLMDLGDGSMIKLTISEYHTVSGRQIHDVGIVPDYEVDMNFEEESDAQLDEAISVLLK